MKNLKAFILLVAIGLLHTACADLDELAPINSIPAETAINNTASAQAALNGVYDEIQDGTLVFDGWLALPQFFSDEADATGTFPSKTMVFETDRLPRPANHVREV